MTIMGKAGFTVGETCFGTQTFGPQTLPPPLILPWPAQYMGPTVYTSPISAPVHEGGWQGGGGARAWGQWMGAASDVLERQPTVTAQTALPSRSNCLSLPPRAPLPLTAPPPPSQDYIQHLSATLTAVSNLSSGALEYATEKFARPLGIPDLFAYDAMDSGRDFSAGGGQMVSCRDVARVGQLVLNKGAARRGGRGSRNVRA